MEDISEWCVDLNSNKKSIIVEGPKDKNSLRAVGISNKIYVLSKKPLFSIIENIAGNTIDIVILTDFDKKGRELYGRLSSGLQRLGVRVDNRMREWLQKNTRLSHIEGLAAYLNKYVNNNAYNNLKRNLM